MTHTIKDKKPLLTRVRRIKGQVEALERAIDQESECTAVLQQIAAIRGAVSGLMTEVLEGHIRDHLSQDIGNSQRRGKNLEQVIRILRSYLK
jgi:DNA-binding FrmR family transcriptional regulator